MHFLNIMIFPEDEGDGDVESHKASLYIGWSGGQNIGVFVLSARFALISLRLVITQDDMREAGRVVGELLGKNIIQSILIVLYCLQKQLLSKQITFKLWLWTPPLFQSQIPPPSGKGAVCGCVQRRSWSSSHARGPRLIIQWHSSPPTHKTSNSVTHKGGMGVPTDSSL